jgi:integrase
VSILSTLSIPDYRRNEATGRGYAVFGDVGMEFGDYDDPHSAMAYDRTLSVWLANGRRLPSPDEIATVESPAGPIPFDRFATELLGLYAHGLRSPATRRGMKHALGVLRELGVRSTADLNVSLIGRLVTTRKAGLSPNTVKGLLRYVQTVCTYAAKSGYLKVNPFAVRPLRTWIRGSAPKGVKHLTRAQIRAILDLLDKDVAERVGFAQWRANRLRCLINICAYCGLRKSEALYLQVDDIDLEAGIIHIVDRAEHRCKTEKSSQPVPIPDGLRPALVDWLEHRLDAPPAMIRPVNPWVFTNMMKPTPWVGGSHGVRALDRFKQAAIRAGVPGEVANLHALRRSLATHLESQGCGQAMITRILRHTTTATSTTFYQKADIDNMRRAVDGFSY